MTRGVVAELTRRSRVKVAELTCLGAELTTGAELTMNLLDVAYCKCSPDSKCGCIKYKKVPIKEVAFLIDQRNERK